MVPDLLKLGLVVLGVVVASPEGRKGLGIFLNGLAEAEAQAQEAKRKEAQRQADIANSVLQRFAIPQPLETPNPTISTAPALVDPDARWREVIVPPAVVLIIGKRGSGKSALAYRILELFRYQLACYVVGAPDHARKLLPDWIGIAPTLEDLPPDCIALVDEAYMLYHSRRSMTQANKAMSQSLNLSRQRNQTVIIVSQEARQVDKNIASSASVVVFKELGILQQEFDRAELRKLMAQATEALAGAQGDRRRWAYVFSTDSDYLGLLTSQLPSFWKPSLSRLYAGTTSTAPPRPGKKLTPQEKAARAKELKARGYSHGQIGKELGVSKSTVTNYLKGYPYRSA